MKYLILFFLLIGIESKAQSNKFILKTFIKNGVKQVEVDLNQDGKTDRIERFSGNFLNTLYLDTKFSGIFDSKISYFKWESAKKPVEIKESDLNGDGKIDRIETIYKDFSHDLLITTISIDSKFNGNFDKNFTEQSKLNQQKDEVKCLYDKNLDDLKILKLTKDINNVKMSLDGGFYVTDWGYKIHQSCLEKWGADVFPALLKSTISTGYQCLANLAKSNDQKNLSPNGAKNNLINLDYLMSTKSVTVVCNEKDYNWPGTSAHASVTPNEVIKENGVTHPFISININDPKEKSSKKELAELSKTLFHEHLHNLGIKHNEDIEFPYTCETCCDPNSTGNYKLSSCKICSGVYTSTSDKNYLKDMIVWSKDSYNEQRAGAAIIKYEKEFPDDRWALFAYADASTSFLCPIGIQMAKILKSKFSKFTDEEEAHLKNIAAFEDDKDLVNPKVVAYSKIMAEAHIDYYFNKDVKKVITNLTQKKEILKELIKTESEAPDSASKFILEDIKTKLDKLLTDIWLANYPKERTPESDSAYELEKYLGLTK